MNITITLPNDVTFLITNNQEVDFETIIYEIIETDEIKIPLAQKLKIKPEKIFNHLNKFVGEEITEGEIIAVKKQLFSDLKYLSEHTGIIKEINHETGELIIQAKNNKQKKQKSFFKGLIKEIKENQLTLSMPQGTKTFPLKKVNCDFGGEIYYFKSKESNLNETDVKNKIIIADSLEPYMQAKVEALGCTGFVTLKSLPNSSDLPQTLGQNIEDFSQIVDYNFHYCLVAERDKNICFYN